MEKAEHLAIIFFTKKFARAQRYQEPRRIRGDDAEPSFVRVLTVQSSRI
jgi:hypothetical protein